MASDGKLSKGDAHPKSVSLEASPSAHFDGKGDVIPMYRSCPALLYFDWMFRFWVYFDTPAHWISWYACAGFFFGGMCFIVGSFCSIAPEIYSTAVVGNCMGDAYDWTVTFAYLLGNCLWFVATSFQIVESLNPGYDQKVAEWESGGRMGPKPKYLWFGLPLTSLAWWGAVSYTVGVALYIGAAVATIINDCPDTLLGTYVYLWLIDYFYLVAGVLFFLSGVAYCMWDISMWLFPAILCPFNRKHATSLQWWALWLYFYGGVGYAIGGIQLYWYSPINTVETLDQYNIITGFGFGGGSICFFLGAALLLSRQSRNRCRPSYAMTASRLDPTMHTGSAYMEPTNGANKV
ncbi:g5521 [Coccomyxa elongata]